jgi:hypothetical protein
MTRHKTIGSRGKNRVRLKARAESAFSVATSGSVLQRKCIAPIRAFVACPAASESGTIDGRFL